MKYKSNSWKEKCIVKNGHESTPEIILISDQVCFITQEIFHNMNLPS
jgi:hypothetical protein